MFGLASLGLPNSFSGLLGPSGSNSADQLSALTPNSALFGALPAQLQTAGAAGNTSLSPLAMLLSGVGIGS